MRAPLFLALVTSLLFGALTLLATPAPLAAQSPVEDCSDDAELRADIALSQHITFTCGPATIPMTMPIVIDKYVEIDGGEVITLTGAGVTHHFEVEDAAGTLHLRNMALVNGAAPTATVPITAPTAGSILNLGVLDLTNVTLADNVAPSQRGAGAIHSDGYLGIRSSRILNNKGGWSGAVVANFDAYLSNSVIEGNQGVAGGAIIASWVVQLERVELRANRATDGSGAIVLTVAEDRPGQLHIFASTIDANNGRQCGAIQSVNVGVSIQNSTISRNISTDGGALCIYSSLNPGVGSGISRSTVSENESKGAAIVLDGNAYFFVTSSTIAFNRPSISDVGGIRASPESIVGGLNAILYRNGDVQCDMQQREYGGFSYSVLGDQSCSSRAFWEDGQTHNRIGNPMLGPLVDNGGPTETHLPGSASIALEMGAPGNYYSGCYWLDQRGVPLWHGLCDAGSVEVETGTPFFLPAIDHPYISTP